MDQSPQLLLAAALCSIVFAVAAMALPIALIKAAFFGAGWIGAQWAGIVALAAAAGILGAVGCHRD